MVRPEQYAWKGWASPWEAGRNTLRGTCQFRCLGSLPGISNHEKVFPPKRLPTIFGLRLLSGRTTGS
jgi:hypothetical protein